jgi:hypothetical protein
VVEIGRERGRLFSRLYPVRLAVVVEADRRSGILPFSLTQIFLPTHK